MEQSGRQGKGVAAGTGAIPGRVGLCAKAPERPRCIWTEIRGGDRAEVGRKRPAFGLRVDAQVPAPRRAGTDLKFFRRCVNKHGEGSVASVTARAKTRLV